MWNTSLFCRIGYRSWRTWYRSWRTWYRSWYLRAWYPSWWRAWYWRYWSKVIPLDSWRYWSWYLGDGCKFETCPSRDIRPRHPAFITYILGKIRADGDECPGGDRFPICNHLLSRMIPIKRNIIQMLMKLSVIMKLVLKSMILKLMKSMILKLMKSMILMNLKLSTDRLSVYWILPTTTRVLLIVIKIRMKFVGDQFQCI